LRWPRSTSDTVARRQVRWPIAKEVVDLPGAAATFGRLLDLGAPYDALRDANQFRYAEPEDIAHLDGIVADARTWRPAIATVDSIGELLPLLRLSSNSPDDFTAAHGRVLKPLARAGAAVVAVDHLAKNNDSRQHGASGTAAKRRAIGGTSLRVTVKEPFTPGRGGSCWLNIHKDRHGGLRAHCPTDTREPLAGIFTLRQDRDVLTWHIATPRDGERPADPGAASVKDIAELDALDPPPESVRDVKARLGWRSERATNALREWRSHRSPGTVGERGTLPASRVPRSPTPMSGNGEHAGTIDFEAEGQRLREQHTACSKHPGTPINSDNGKCPRCILDGLERGVPR
jgi:hypothetical protein